MVSAVFHSPLEASQQLAEEKQRAASLPVRAELVEALRQAQGGRVVQERIRIDWHELWLRVLPPVIGIALLVGIWALLTANSTTFPTPWATFDAAVKPFADQTSDEPAHRVATDAIQKINTRLAAAENTQPTLLELEKRFAPPQPPANR